jgi:hypothetical protein
MTQENMVKVYAPINVQEHVEKAAEEKASFLAFPEEKQGDLQYIRSILVSAGTNKNGAHFLPSEMMKAHNTVVHKAIDIEHEEDKVIGHIYDCAFLFKDGTPFDPKKVIVEYQEASQDPDSLDIDIAVAGVVHKMRFPELSDEISGGDWKVSMECFFRDFDILVGNQIISRQEAQALGYNPEALIGGFVKVVVGSTELGKHFASRVLRDITFSGMGIVKNPANPHSIILETAAHKERMEKGPQVIDLEQIDNLRGNAINVRGDSKKEEASETDLDLQKINAINEEGVDAAEDNDIYVELDKETGGIKRVFSTNKEEGAIRWSGPGIGGPGSINSYPDEICKSFKKRVTKFNALDQSEGVVLHEHWCALFEEACPVIGATAKAPECLRNQKNRTTRDEGDNTLTKTVREHLDGGPGNTFMTVPTQPTLSRDAASTDDRLEQSARLRQQAQNLRNSLREFVAAEKKTSK